MAFIIEQAGGKATNGDIGILDIKPTDIHERAPIFIGSADNVNDFLRVREKCKKEAEKWSSKQTQYMQQLCNTHITIAHDFEVVNIKLNLILR